MKQKNFENILWIKIVVVNNKISGCDYELSKIYQNYLRILIALEKFFEKEDKYLTALLLENGTFLSFFLVHCE